MSGPNPTPQIPIVAGSFVRLPCFNRILFLLSRAGLPMSRDDQCISEFRHVLAPWFHRAKVLGKLLQRLE